MRIGFTGTRRGMTAQQEAELSLLLIGLSPIEFHHGLCRGADAEAHGVARNDPPVRIMIVGHPGPKDDPNQIKTLYPDCDELRPHKTHFARNRGIVDETEVLIACPAEMEHRRQGGTWYTYDYARKKGRRVILILPDGQVRDEDLV